METIFDGLQFGQEMSAVTLFLSSRLAWMKGKIWNLRELFSPNAVNAMFEFIGINKVVSSFELKTELTQKIANMTLLVHFMPRTRL